MHTDQHNENSILEEFASDNTHQKSKLFTILGISLVAYIAFVLIDLSVDTRRFSLKSFDWQVAAVILTLPCLGIGFHLAGKKAGWIINALYYSFMTLIFSYLILSELLKGKIREYTNRNWEGLVLLSLLLIPTVLLFCRPTRKYFRVNLLLCLFIPGIALTLAIIALITW